MGIVWTYIIKNHEKTHPFRLVLVRMFTVGAIHESPAEIRKTIKLTPTDFENLLGLIFVFYVSNFDYP